MRVDRVLEGARDTQVPVRPLKRRGSPTVLLTIEMERADLDQSVEAREAGAARLGFLELSLIVCHMLRIRPVVLWGKGSTAEVERFAWATRSQRSVSETVMTGIGAPGGGGEEGSSVGEQVGDGGRLR